MFMLLNCSNFFMLKMIYLFRSSDLSELLKPKFLERFKAIPRCLFCLSTSFEGYDFEILINGSLEITILEERAFQRN